MTETVTNARTARDAARDTVGQAASRLAAARAAMRASKSTDTSPDARAKLERRYQEATHGLREAKTGETTAHARLSEALREFQASPLESIGRLDAHYPIAFFPVRIESRFRRQPPPNADGAVGELLLRIYPDSILADEHEPLLTQDEVDAGRAYWRRAWAEGGERDAWTLLLREMSAERGAWVVEQTVPSNQVDRPADGDGGGAVPMFADPSTRPDGWHRAPEARGLPDRWIVTAYRNGQARHQVFSKAVLQGLALTFRLSGDGEEAGIDDFVDLSGDGLEIEPAVRWVYDFDEAVNAGMAVRIPLVQEDFDLGFSHVVVAGVRTSETPEAQAEEVERLIHANNVSRGVAFVPQGAKTNNSKDNPSNYPPDDLAGATSFETHRGASLIAPNTDGERFMAALGLDQATGAHLWGADRDEQSAAMAMADALWPATMGYFLHQMMAPHVSADMAAQVRRHLAAHVRARGPYPAIRFGSVPYGLVPVGSLFDWPSRTDGKTIDEVMPEALQRLARIWLRLTGAVPRVGRSGDPDADLIEALAMDASAQTVQIRRTLGYDATWNILSFSGIDLSRWEETQRIIAQQVLQGLGEPNWDPRVLYMNFADSTDDFAGPLVDAKPVSETDPLEFDYIAWLRAASPESLRDQSAPPAGTPVNALLYLMLRHGMLAEYDAAAKDILDRRKLLDPSEEIEAELIAVTNGGDTTTAKERTAWDRFELKVAGVTGDRTIGRLLADPLAVQAVRDPRIKPIFDVLSSYRQSLRKLEGLPTAELDRLFTETLDIFSHRSDAWLTGLYTQRIKEMREAKPQGLYIGCYGWVEDLRADPPGETVTVVTANGGKEQARTDSGGYIYAPSMLHGAAAAVLRSAYLARSGPSQEPYAIDLSSRRVRTALWLVDTVREDQPLGAALGYRFERGLHENHPGIELDRFIDEFRRLYPLVANKTVATVEAAESIAARNVVDGLRLREGWRASSIPWGTQGLEPDTAERTAIEAELARLDDAIDAVSDLMMAEGVYQVLKGSTAGAAATLDSLAKGTRAPEPEVATIPRSGTALHQRFAIVLGDGSLSAEWSAIAMTPRALAAPELNAWLAGIFGDPNTVECLVAPERAAAQAVTAADLGLQAIDLFALTRPAEVGAQNPEIGRRIAWLLSGIAGADVVVSIDYETAQSPEAISFAQIFEISSAIGQVLGLSRPLQPKDLLPPELEPRIEEADLMTAEIDSRRVAALAALDQAISGLSLALSDIGAAPEGVDPDLNALRAALVTSGLFGIGAALPALRHDNSAAAKEALVAAGKSVLKELRRRRDNALAAPKATGQLTAIFGRWFPVIGRFRPAAPEILAPALNTEPNFDGGSDSLIEGWIAELSKVRDPIDAWQRLSIYARSFGRLPDRPRIVQLPLENDLALARWAALPFAREQERPKSGLVSLALLGASPPQATAAWSGLLIDSWPELIPSAEEDAGVVFHYDAPGAQAPQAILLAVPPPNHEQWSFQLVERTLFHAFDLARIRAMDLSNLGLYGQVLPMSFLAANPANATVSTSFIGLLMTQAVIQPTET